MRSRFLVLAAIAGMPAIACSSGRVAPSTALSPLSADSVSVGYGRRPRASLTGSVALLTEETLRDMRVARVEEMLEGRIPGVQVFRNARGGLSVRVRGVHSFLASEEPLWVVDGVPLMQGPSGLLAIAPQDVARIEVLKDAATTSIYGVRGANGVILVTTKRR